MVVKSGTSTNLDTMVNLIVNGYEDIPVARYCVLMFYSYAKTTRDFTVIHSTTISLLSIVFRS